MHPESSQFRSTFHTHGSVRPPTWWKAKAKERGTFASITARQVPKINGTPHGAKSSSDGAMEDEMRRALIGLTVAALTVLALAGPASAAPAR